MKITHNIVYSTKGGCGKTTFSFWLAHVAHQINKDNKLSFVCCDNDKNCCDKKLKLKSNIHVHCKESLSVNCLIDLDLLGSSTTRCFGINTSNDPNTHVVTLQELIKGTKKPNEIQLWKHNIKDAKKVVLVVPVDAAEKEKEIFYYKRNNTPLLKYEEITSYLDYIQKGVELYLKSKGFNNNDTLNFIYDLPLNADGYTEAILDEIFKCKKMNDDKDTVRLYLVSNSESMLECNIDWLEKFFGTFQKRECNVTIVHNNNIVNSKNVDEKILDSWINTAVRKKVRCDEKVKEVMLFKMCSKKSLKIEEFDPNPLISVKSIIESYELSQIIK